MSMPPPIPQQQLSYATPGQMGTYQWEGKTLITPTYAILPHLCIKCGEPGTVRKTRKLVWVQPWVIATAVVALLITLILYLVLQKKGTVEFSMCRRHANARLRNIALAWLCAVASIGGLILTASADDIMGRNQGTPLVITGLVLFFGLLITCIVFAILAPPLKPKKITDQFMKLTGFGAGFRERAVFDEFVQQPTHAFPVGPVR